MSFIERASDYIQSFIPGRKSVRDSQLWLTQMLDYLPKPFFLLDFETNRVTFSNASARRMLGLDYASQPSDQVYEKDIFLYDSDGKLVDVTDLPSARVLSGEKMNGEEFSLVTKAGRFSIKIFSEDIPAMYGQKRAALIVFQDITALKKTEDNLLRVQADLNEAIDIAQIGFWSVDLITNETTLSPALLKQFGMNEETYDGTLSAALQNIHPDDRERVRLSIEKSIADGAPYHLEYRVVHPNGEVRWIEAKSGGRASRYSDLNRFSGTTLDVTERVKARQALEAKEKALHEALAIAENANAAKSQFLANMSHEIRTPLGAIMGFADLLRDNEIDPKYKDDYIAVIERNSSQLMAIVDDILDLSKVEAGMLVIENIEFSLPEMLHDFTSLMEFKAREKGILFNLQRTTPLPKKVKTDPTRLRQILLNVVGNAIKFTDKGHVTLRVGFEDDFLNFEVEDTGRGISPEQTQNLFKPFSQADASTTRIYGGTGLGLVLSRSLSEALGGQFSLKHSELGKGSTFAIRIFAKADSIERHDFESSSQTQAKASMPTGMLRGMHILVVEDSKDNQTLISIFLKGAGATLDIASDGEQGVKAATSKPYDMVLMDVQMPKMDGITAMKELRKLNYEKPVIALTAHAMQEERERCLQAGFSDFLSKPLNREELIDTILEHHSRFREVNQGPL